MVCHIYDLHALNIGAACYLVPGSENRVIAVPVYERMPFYAAGRSGGSEPAHFLDARPWVQVLVSGLVSDISSTAVESARS